MQDVIIYVTPICPYCVRAKALFDKLGVPYKIIDVSTSDDLRKEMILRSNGRTSVPQIFIGDVHIGGFDDLYALYVAQELNTYLNH
ncbi:MAG: glutaredoxin 3 [Alphaproteobacteria bacterium]|nr:glutaredoxin 3 [Alphaproteobacteria bacterium]